MISKKLSLQVAFEMIVALAGLSACQKAPHEVPGTVLYEIMLREDEKHSLVFEEFPKALEPMIGLYQGGIFTTNYGDTLQLICSYPNLCDKVNRYPIYFMRDNHGFYWTMLHEDDDKYHIYREDSRWAKKIYKREQKSLDELKSKEGSYEIVPSIFSMGLTC